MSLCSSIVLKEQRYTFYAFVKIIKSIMFVWRMNRVGGQTKAHQYGFSPKDFLKHGSNGDAAATAEGEHFCAERSLHCFFCCIKFLCITWQHVRHTSVMWVHFHLYIGRSNFLKILCKLFSNLLRSLIWHKTH